MRRFLLPMTLFAVAFLAACSKPDESRHTPDLAKLKKIHRGELSAIDSYDDAMKMQKGELDPNAAFMQGRMKVAGNVAKLMALLPLTNSPEYKQLQEQVREMSEF